MKINKEKVLSFSYNSISDKSITKRIHCLEILNDPLNYDLKIEIFSKEVLEDINLASC